MKKSKSIWLLSGAALAFGFASCTQDTAMNTASQATIDSIVNAKVDSIRISMMASNDSLIEALAYQKADSIVAALNAKSSGSKAPVVVPKPKPKPTPEPVRPGTGGIKPVREAEKTVDPGSVTNRPGAKDNTPKAVNDRPGAKDTSPKSVNDRPGAKKNN